MPSVASKRVLKDDSNAHNKGGLPDSHKKRKLDLPNSGAKENRVPTLSQQKSSFEDDLERLTQEITELKGGEDSSPCELARFIAKDGC